MSKSGINYFYNESIIRFLVIDSYIENELRGFMKKIYVVFFLLLNNILFCFTQIVSTRNIVIPFELSDENRIILSFYDNETLYNFEFDTGANFNALYRSGMQKLINSDESTDESIIEKLIENFHLVNPNLSLEYLKNQVLSFFYSDQLKILINTLNCNYSVFNNVAFKFNSIQKQPYNNGDTIDGIIGLNIFGEIDNIVIDYKKKQIEINVPCTLKNAVKMYQFEGLNLFYVFIRINGIEQQALIDTGARYISIREDYKTNIIYSVDEIVDFLRSDYHVKVEKNTDMVLSFELGNYKYSGSVFKYTAEEFDCQIETRRFLRMINSLGFPFFSDKRIQLDFVNNLFCID